MTIKVKILGNTVTKDGAKHINDIQVYEDNDFNDWYTFVNYITYQLRASASFVGLVYYLETI